MATKSAASTLNNQAKQTTVQLKKSEERYKAFIQHSTEGIWRFELTKPLPVNLPVEEQIEHCFKYAYLAECNNAMAKMYGFNSAEELVGAKLTDLLIPTDPKNIAFLKQFVENSYRISNAISHELDKSGNEKYFTNNFTGIIENNTLTRVWGTQRDITEHRKTEIELHQYKERLDRAQKAGRVGIFDWNIKTNTVWWSTEEEFLLGLTEGSLQKGPVSWAQAIPKQEFQRVLKKINTSMNQKSEYEDNFYITLADGSIRWLSCKGHFYYDSESKPERMIGINMDITEKKQIEEAVKFKAEATRIISSSLDYKTTLKNIGTVAVPYIADWYAVDLLDDKGQIQLVAIMHKDPKKIKFARELRKKDPIDLNANQGVAKVLKTGKAEFYPDISDEMLRQSAKDERQLKLMREIGFSSVIIAPIKTQGKTIGTLTLVSAESKRHYTSIDLEMAEQLGTRIGLAIDNATLYETVQKDQERLNTLLANVPGVVWEAKGDPDHPAQLVSFVNSYVETMLGYKVDKWLNTPNFWLQIVHPDDKERAAREAAEIFNSGHGGISRFRWITQDGKILWVEAHSSVIKDKKGLPIGMRGVTMDISDRVELEKRKDEFIGLASHELKTPITTIKAFTQLLDKYFDNLEDDKAGNYLDKMAKQVEKLTTLIEDLLDVSRIQSGKLQLHEESFAIDQLINETIEDIQTIAHNHTIIKKGSTDAKVFADKYRIAQVLTNLLTNAIKYSPNAKQVEVIISTKSNHVQIEVRDYGIGIPKSQQDKIFDRYYRVEEKKNKHFPGLGLGLHISYEIIKRHRGQIWVESNENKGSTFYVSLPTVKNKSKSQISN